MTNKVKIGMAQLLVEGGEPERNFERATKLLEEAVADNCEVVLFPETIDFAWTHPSALEEAKPIPGSYSDVFTQLALKHNVFVCVGLTEKTENGKLYNTALLIDPSGQIVAKHRKINLLEVEFPFYEVGQSLQVVDTSLGKIGLNICADNYIESLSLGHSLARMGAQIILSPSSWTVDYSITEEDDPYEDKWVKPLSTLARLYNMVVVSTTSVGYIVGGPYEGKKKVGCSLAVNQQGVIAQGQFNEFAGELTVCEFEVPERAEKGTQIGDSLKKQGFQFEQ